MLATISPTSLLLVLLIIAILFGTKRLRNIGGDLGAAFRSFRKGMAEEESKDEATHLPTENNKTADNSTVEK